MVSKNSTADPRTIRLALSEMDRRAARSIHVEIPADDDPTRVAQRDWIEHDPDYDSLRGDPRFRRLLARLK